MSDEATLFAVLCLIYISDCFFWVPKNSLAFLSWTNNDWHAKAKKGILRSSKGELAILNPLPPLGAATLSDHPPFSISPQGLVALNPQTLVFSDEPAEIPPVFLFEQMQAIRVTDRDILIDQMPFCRCATAHQALELGNLLESIRLMDEQKREKRIEDFWQVQLNYEAAKRRLLEAKADINKFRYACNFLFAYLFILLPLLIVYFEFGGILIPAGITAFLLAQLTCCLFFMSHKKIFPDLREERITHVVKMAVCPPAAVRAGDLLSQGLLRGYNPIVVAHILLSHDRFIEFASKTIRRLTYPNIPASAESGALAVIDWHNRILIRLFTRYISAQAGIQNDGLSPPEPNDVGVVSYCPRCLSQYSVERESCSDCSNTRLVVFDRSHRQ